MEAKYERISRGASSPKLRFSPRGLSAFIVKVVKALDHVLSSCLTKYPCLCLQLKEEGKKVCTINLKLTNSCYVIQQD